MEASVKQRLKEIIRLKGMTVNQLSVCINTSQSTLTRQINGDTSLSVNTLLSIYEYFRDISIEWLLTGKGEMYISTTSDEPLKTDDSITTERLLAIIESQQRTIENLLKR